MLLNSFCKSQTQLAFSYLNKNRFFQICNHVLVVTHSTLIKYVVLLAVTLCFPEVVPATKGRLSMFFKRSKEEQTRSVQQRDVSITPQFVQLRILSVVGSLSPAEGTQPVPLWSFRDKRSMQYPQSSGFVGPRWCPTPKPSSASPLYSSPCAPQQKMLPSVEKRVHKVAQHPSCAGDSDLGHQERETWDSLVAQLSG